MLCIYKVKIVLHDNDKLLFSEFHLSAWPNIGFFFTLECIFVQRCKTKSIVVFFANTDQNSISPNMRIFIYLMKMIFST